MKLLHTLIALVVLALPTWAQTEMKNDLGLLLGGGFIPQRTTEGGAAMGFPGRTIDGRAERRS